jgi:hypothetical protein
MYGKGAMTNRERFRAVLNFEPVDRLPMVEWATWWDKTLDRWYGEGLPRDLGGTCEIGEFFGMDAQRQWWINGRSATCPQPPGHGKPIMSTREDYLALKPHLYEAQPFDADVIRKWAELQKSGESVVWISLDGFFWFPRTLFGIEPHLYAFYDQPELMKEINDDLLAFNLRALDQFCEICVPDFMTFGEDMSYNHGPMISEPLFEEFIAPYYSRIVPKILEYGITPIVDSDGDITELVKWFTRLGIQGFLPLERMAGVDVAELRRAHPTLRMMGAFDKTVMHRGEEAIRAEFERLLPVMRQGGFVPSVDHQTPPQVSIEQYRLYVSLLKEYCEKAGGSS